MATSSHEIQLQLKEPLVEEKCKQTSPDDIPTQTEQDAAQLANKYILYFILVNRKRVRKSQKKFILVITLNIIYIIAQIIGGLLSNSYV